MEGEKQLLSEETVKCHGIEAPSLVQKGITADEENTQENTIEKEIQELSAEVSTTEQNPCEPDQIEVTFELQESKKESNETGDGEGILDNKDEEKSDNEVLDRNTSVENVQSSSERKKDSNNESDSEKTQNAAEEKHNEEKSNESKGANGNNFVEVILDDGNNNVAKIEGSTKDKRARFSSEITIQPKAYFQAGGETVVMMPPSSTSDEVFRNESTESQDPASSSPHVVLRAQPSDSVLPRTFLPLTVFSCIFCCPMIGLFAVYKSFSVKEFIKRGDIRKANEASQHARQLGFLTVFIGFFFVLAIVTIAVLVSTLT